MVDCAFGILYRHCCRRLFGHSAQKDPVVCRRALPLCHGAAGLPPADGGRRAAQHMGAGLVVHQKAGLIILPSSILIWLLSSFGIVGGGLVMVEDMDLSLLANLGNLFAFLFIPLGFGNWQSSVATVMGLVAKEEVVSVFGTLYGVAGDAGIRRKRGIWRAGRHCRAFHRAIRILLSHLQPALRALLCCYWRNPAGDEQRKMDLGDCGLPDRLGLQRGAHRLSAGAILYRSGLYRLDGSGVFRCWGSSSICCCARRLKTRCFTRRRAHERSFHNTPAHAARRARCTGHFRDLHLPAGAAPQKGAMHLRMFQLPL